MKKKNIIRKSEEYSQILKKTKPINTTNFLIYLKKETTEQKFGIVVSKKIGNAVIRNYCKRILRHILDEFTYTQNFHCVVVCKNSLKSKNYNDLKHEISLIFHQKGII